MLRTADCADGALVSYDTKATPTRRRKPFGNVWATRMRRRSVSRPLEQHTFAVG